jgi:membrane protease YdiL (CAAX protease family)
VALGLGLAGPILAVLLSMPVAALAGAGQVPLVVTIGLLLVAGQYLAFGGLALAYLRRRGLQWPGVQSYLGIRVPSIRELLIVPAGWVLILGILMVVGLIVNALGAETGQNQTAELAFESPEIIPPLIVAMFLVVGPSEEILYRGVVQGRLRESLDAIPSIAVASAIFALVHWFALTGGASARLASVMVLFFPSLVFGAVYEYTDNLVVPALIHGAYNATLFTVLYYVIRYGGDLQDQAAVLP